MWVSNIQGIWASVVLNYNPGTFDNYLHSWVDATAGGRFVPEGIISPVVRHEYQLYGHFNEFPVTKL